MTRKILIAASLLFILLAIVVSLTRPLTPAIVQSIRQLSEVARVNYSGPAEPSMTIIHIRDWHHVPRELCELDGINFEENLAIVSKVQKDELAIARFLIREHGVNEVFSEGIAEEASPGLKARIDLLRSFGDAEKAGVLDDEGRAMQREMSLEVGVPGRLLLAGEIAKVRPAEDRRALKAAGPGADATKIEARRRAIVARLPKTGIALLVLGGSHDLTSHLDADVLYVRMTPRSYPAE